MTKVDELIERVKLTHTEIDNVISDWLLGEGNSYPAYYPALHQRMCETQLNKVLNDPDLYVIDKTCYTYPETGKKLAYIIPLREAIKEVNNG